MKKIIVYLFSGAWYFEVLFDKFAFITVTPFVKIFCKMLYIIFPFLKRNIKKKEVSVDQHIKDTLKKCKQFESNDVGGFSQRSVERYLTYLLFLFFAEAVCIFRRLLNIGVLNKLIHNYTFAVLFVCALVASFSVSKIEDFVMKGKRLTTLNRKPKDFQHKALFVFFASCFIVIFVFLRLWWFTS